MGTTNRYRIVIDLISNARLTAACEHAWRSSGFDRKTDWRPGSCITLPLVKLYPRLADFNYRDLNKPILPDQPKCLVVFTPALMSLEVVITAPGIDEKFMWIAGRYHWRAGWEDNYTKG